MPSRILILQGHPDPAGGHLCNALAAAYREAAEGGGHEIRSIELATLEIPVLRTQSDFESGQVPPSLEDAVDALRWAEHIVLIFPLWLGTMPGLVKLFLEQVFRPGVAFSYQERGLPKKLLAGARRGSSSRWECRPSHTAGSISPTACGA